MAWWLESKCRVQAPLRGVPLLGGILSRREPLLRFVPRLSGTGASQVSERTALSTTRPNCSIGRSEAFLLHFDKRRGIYSCRSARGANARTEHRSSARHTRSLDPANSGAWTHARLGHFGTHPSGFQQGSPGQSRVAVSGAASPRAPRLDQGALGHIRKQPPCEILRTHQKRAEAARTSRERV